VQPASGQTVRRAARRRQQFRTRPLAISRRDTPANEVEGSRTRQPTRRKHSKIPPTADPNPQNDGNTVNKTNAEQVGPKAGLNPPAVDETEHISGF
jgi:hypothetical protein